MRKWYDYAIYSILILLGNSAVYATNTDLRKTPLAIKVALPTFGPSGEGTIHDRPLTLMGEHIFLGFPARVSTKATLYDPTLSTVKMELFGANHRRDFGSIFSVSDVANISLEQFRYSTVARMESNYMFPMGYDQGHGDQKNGHTRIDRAATTGSIGMPFGSKGQILDMLSIMTGLETHVVGNDGIIRTQHPDAGSIAWTIADFIANGDKKQYLGNSRTRNLFKYMLLEYDMIPEHSPFKHVAAAMHVSLPTSDLSPTSEIIAPANNTSVNALYLPHVDLQTDQLSTMSRSQTTLPPEETTRHITQHNMSKHLDYGQVDGGMIILISNENAN